MNARLGGAIRRSLGLVLVLTAAWAPSRAEEPPGRCFRVRVVDQETGRGVPMVELRTVHHVLYLTDSAGWAAIDEPGLMGREVYFHVQSHGYEHTADGLGFRGVRLRLEPGGSAVVKVKRLNVAERLYRVTGQGIYRDSVRLGEEAPLERPVLNGLVAGQDSVVNAIYHGRLYWFWGDTNRVGYPLGNYRVSGAVSDLPGHGGLDPSVGVNLEYFTGEDGFCREMFPSAEPGAIWIFGLMVLRQEGRETLATHYSRVRDVGHRYEHGIGVWNDERQVFEKRVEFPPDAPVYPHGQPVEVTAGDERWYYFCNPYPVMRVRAKLADVLDPARYEAFTCYEPGGRRDGGSIQRGSDGKAVWGWKPDTAPPRTPQGLFDIPSPEGMGPEGLYHLTDVETGKPIRGHGGSVFWNGYRRKWVMVLLESMGRSMLGEVWYAEGDTILGPWVYARRIVTHDRYSFYNVKQHPYFDQDGGRRIYFEGTYTDFVSGAPRPTPWYDYNQIMYRLDLSDARLHLPAPVYERVVDGRVEYVFQTDPDDPPPVDAAVRFYAMPPERAIAGTARVGLGRGAASFHALPAEPSPGEAANPAVVPLYEYRRVSDGRLIYATEPPAPGEGWERAADPVCRVWRSPRADPPRQPDARPVPIAVTP